MKRKFKGKRKTRLAVLLSAVMTLSMILPVYAGEVSLPAEEEYMGGASYALQGFAGEVSDYAEAGTGTAEIAGAEIEDEEAFAEENIAGEAGSLADEAAGADKEAFDGSIQAFASAILKHFTYEEDNTDFVGWDADMSLEEKNTFIKKTQVDTDKYLVKTNPLERDSQLILPNDYRFYLIAIKDSEIYDLYLTSEGDTVNSTGSYEHYPHIYLNESNKRAYIVNIGDENAGVDISKGYPGNVVERPTVSGYYIRVFHGKEIQDPYILGRLRDFAYYQAGATNVPSSTLTVGYIIPAEVSEFGAPSFDTGADIIWMTGNNPNTYKYGLVKLSKDGLSLSAGDIGKKFFGRSASKKGIGGLEVIGGPDTSSVNAIAGVNSITVSFVEDTAKALEAAPNTAQIMAGSTDTLYFRIVDRDGKPVKSGSVKKGESTEVKDLPEGTYSLDGWFCGEGSFDLDGEGEEKITQLSPISEGLAEGLEVQGVSEKGDEWDSSATHRIVFDEKFVDGQYTISFDITKGVMYDGRKKVQAKGVLKKDAKASKSKDPSISLNVYINGQQVDKKYLKLKFKNNKKPVSANKGQIPPNITVKINKKCPIFKSKEDAKKFTSELDAYFKKNQKNPKKLLTFEILPMWINEDLDYTRLTWSGNDFEALYCYSEVSARIVIDKTKVKVKGGKAAIGKLQIEMTYTNIDNPNPKKRVKLINLKFDTKALKNGKKDVYTDTEKQVSENQVCATGEGCFRGSLVLTYDSANKGLVKEKKPFKPLSGNFVGIIIKSEE